MFNAIISLGVMGAAFGGLLAFAAQKFAVEADPRVEAIKAALPGANCGACGKPGCAGLAEAIARGEVPVNACPVGGAAVGAKVGEIMGIKVDPNVERRIAKVLCQGGCVDRSDYHGPQDCKAAVLVGGGHKSCTYACVGFGNCARVCPFGAITMSDKGLPVIDEEKCTGCTKCVAECPKAVLSMAPVSKAVHVACVSKDKGPMVRKTECKPGCIACGICQKNCPHDAIHVVNNLAVIDYDKCVNCGVCVAKCPTKAIIMEEHKVPKDQ